MPNIFRICGRDEQESDVAGTYVVDKLYAKRVAVMHDKDTYGTKKVICGGLTRGKKGFNILVAKIYFVDANVVCFGGLHSDATPLVR